MRKNAPRKWLHAVLDLLPVILIPVFMIYSHRHTIDSYELQYPQNKVVDFNQLMPTEYYFDNPVQCETYKNGFSAFAPENSINTKVIYYFDWIENHEYLLRYNCFTDSNVTIDNLTFLYNTGTNQYYTSNIDGNVQLLTYIYDSDKTAVGQIQFYRDMTTYKVYYYNINIFDLTQMFGYGNEPTIQQFNEWYPDEYYSYTLSHKELLKGYSFEMLNDTDIMSQFTYNLYNSVDKYFNMNNIFNMNQVYDWFNLNIFNGNAPLYVYIVWNIILYEFVMDLLFLLYALFMFFIDFCTSLIERCYTSGKGGK